MRVCVHIHSHTACALSAAVRAEELLGEGALACGEAAVEQHSAEGACVCACKRVHRCELCFAADECDRRGRIGTEGERRSSKRRCTLPIRERVRREG